MNILNNKYDENIIEIVIFVISEQLEQENIMLDDNFYDLGGDSLSAMRIKNSLEDKLNVKISIEDIMLSETIREFANSIR
ncbi:MULTISPECIES: acyl carrier protein [Mammaliicoccus]|uniref:acyl carrier protein n=1 Tax=Mammaliicoccus TaxID=2803850 RepID=UPI001EFB319E|nr:MULTISPECIES: acyl carrier protein [Mammaliicoccus]